MSGDSDILVCKDLGMKYQGALALDGLNLQVKSGRIIGLLGPDGSGKTTLLKIAAGIISQTSGTVSVGGCSPGAASKAMTAFLPDLDFLPPNKKVGKLLDYHADFFKDFNTYKAKKLLRSFRISTSMFPDAMNKGMREKLKLAFIMCRKARLYLLDEPVGGVDPADRDSVLCTILDNCDPEATVIISTHLVHDVEKILDEAVFMERGKNVLHENVKNMVFSLGKSLSRCYREVFGC